MEDLRNKRVTVAGLGHFGGGIAVARWLVGQGAKVLVTDLASADKLADSLSQLAGLPIEFYLGDHRESDFADADLVVTSPAVPPVSRFIAAARNAGVPVSTEMRLFLERCPAKRVIGVTGTKGKSTTTALLGLMLKTRHTTWVGGNIGKSLLAELGAIQPDHVVLLELSSYMLEYLRPMRWSPHVAVVTFMSADHTEWHGSHEAYLGAKVNLVRHQTPADFAILPEGDAGDRFAQATAGQVSRYRLEKCRRFDLPLLPGEHNQLNAQAAFEAASKLGPVLQPQSRVDAATEVADSSPVFTGVGNGKNLDAATEVADSSPEDPRLPSLRPSSTPVVRQTPGVSWEDAQAAVRGFGGLPHRLQLVHEAGGVRYYNDSIATIPQAAIVACNAFDAGRVIQIIGGADKKLDMRPMCQALARRCKAVLTIGTLGPDLAAMCTGPARVESCGTLEQAMRRAKQLATGGDVVLLSTGCASYDQFTHFEQRGNEFARLAAGG